MEITESKAADTTVLDLAGRLDTNTCKALEDRLNGLVAGGAASLLIDFSGIDYISSAGLRVLLACAKQMKQKQGRLALSGMQPQVREIFDISGFSKIFTIIGSRDEALASPA